MLSRRLQSCWFLRIRQTALPDAGAGGRVIRAVQSVVPTGHSWELSILSMRSDRLRPARPGVEATSEPGLSLIIQLGGPCGQEISDAGGAVVVVGSAITCAAVVSKPGKVFLFEGLATTIWQTVQCLIVGCCHPGLEGREMPISANKELDQGAGLGAIEAWCGN